MPSLSTRPRTTDAQPLEPAAAALADTFGELLPGGPDIACGVDEFVVAAAGAAARTSNSACCARAVRYRASRLSASIDVGGMAPAAAERRTINCRTVRTRRRSRMPGAPTSVDWRACFSRMSDMSTWPG